MNMMTEEFEQTSPHQRQLHRQSRRRHYLHLRACQRWCRGAARRVRRGHIYFTFDGASEVSLEPSDELAGIRVKFGKTELSKVTNAMREFDTASLLPIMATPLSNSSSIPMSFVGPGVMTISIDAGAFTVDGAPSPAIEYSCTFGDVKEYVEEPTPLPPGSSIESLAQFKLEFPEAKKASVYEEYIIPPQQLVDCSPQSRLRP